VLSSRLALSSDLELSDRFHEALQLEAKLLAAIYQMMPVLHARAESRAHAGIKHIFTIIVDER
jgi:hypothetical protein